MPGLTGWEEASVAPSPVLMSYMHWWKLLTSGSHPSCMPPTFSSEMRDTDMMKPGSLLVPLIPPRPRESHLEVPLEA